MLLQKALYKRPVQLCPKHYWNRRGFTLAEVLVAIAVAVLFGLAAFATNERLLLALKTQKETTAATMMLQERMEAFRSLTYSNAASSQASASPSPPQTAADIVADATTSEAPLGNLSETITVSGYLTTSGGSGYPSDGSTSNQWVRNSTYPTGNLVTSNANLATSYDLLQVDIKVSWTSAGGRTRNRELAAIVGKGNIGIGP